MAGPAEASRAALAHLYRRAGFGARPDELDAAVARGYDASVALLLDVAAPDPGVTATPPPALSLDLSPIPKDDQKARQARRQQEKAAGEQLVLWWLDRMVMATNPLPEKLAWFWHGHFATSVQKVNSPALMLRQNEIFRRQGAGKFEALTGAVAKDAAMLIWLDGRANRKEHPNENFARELLELFVLGVGNYAESDVREAARCFTGWTLDRTTGDFRNTPVQHDTGVKTVLGQTGPFSGDDVIRIAVSTPASARWVVSRLWTRFATPVRPDDAAVSALLPAYGDDRNISRLLGAMLRSPAFTSDPVRQGLVKSPVEWLVGTLRALGLRARDPKLVAALVTLGQVPFAPPSVGGWPDNQAWLSTAASLGRLQIAQMLLAQAEAAPVVQALAATATGDRPATAAALLGIGAWSPRTTMALRSVADDPPKLLALALVAAENVVN